MATELTKRIQNNPQYQALSKQRDSLGWWLTALVVAVYYGFILVIAYSGELFAIPIMAGMTTTWGIPVGFGIILLTIVVTAIYVRKANNEYDRMTKEILDKEVLS
jgi:uncharacterized membrane protein (DUF485 family)